MKDLLGGKDWRVLVGDSLSLLPDLPAGVAQVCITSPPYFGLRDYNVEGQIGLEGTPDLFVNRLVTVFREVRRILRDDGTLWLNLGDSYCASKTGGDPNLSSRLEGGKATQAQAGLRPDKRPGNGLKTKDLIGIPWMVAFALRADGWYLRSDIIWSKPNPMPESVTDRPTKAHEYFFLLTKNARYFYDAEAIREGEIKGAAGSRFDTGKTAEHQLGRAQKGERKQDALGKRTYTGFNDHLSLNPTNGRNKRSVWEVSTYPYPEAHFATFPPALIEPCVLAGTPQKGCCSACGTPWRRVTERYETGETQKMADGWDTGEGGHGAFHRDGREKGEKGIPVMASRTTGWEPTCSCDAPTIPSLVLDPFSGSGTTGEVVVAMGRRYLGLELNPDYAEMSERRISGLPYYRGGTKKRTEGNSLSLWEGEAERSTHRPQAEAEGAG